MFEGTVHVVHAQQKMNFLVGILHVHVVVIVHVPVYIV